MDFSGAAQVLANYTSAGGITPGSSFEAIVRSSNVLVRNALATDIRDIALNQAYPRIGLILSAAKSRKNFFLFPLGNTGTATAQERYDTILSEFDPTTGIYASGLRRVAAFLTASVLTRNIPLQSSIQQVSSGDMMEKQALEDLDRIISLYDTETTAGLTTATGALSSINLFITLGIDTATLPAANFDAPDALAPLDIDGSSKVPIEPQSVKSYRTVPYQGGKVAYCWFYLTGTEDKTPAVPSIQGIFQIPTDDATGTTKGFTAEEVIQRLADEVNSSTLNSLKESNIIVAPNKGPNNIQRVSVRKSTLYPDTTSNSYRLANFVLEYTVSYLGFDVRRYSNIVSRELIILNFYTTEAANFPASPATATDDAITTLRRNSTVGIKGLWYGASNNYSQLDELGPHSLIVQVEKTHAAAIASSGGGSATDEKEKDKLLPDTFYFKLGDPTLGLGSFDKPLLRWRVSTTPPIGDPPINVEYIIDVTNPSNPILTAEDLSLAFLQSMYSYTEITTTEQRIKYPDGLVRAQATSTTISESSSGSGISESNAVALTSATNQGNNVLGALVHPDAVQIVAFRVLDLNFKAIVDILETPSNLQIATGTPLQLKSTYKEGARSIVVDSQLMKISLKAGAGSGGTSKAEGEIELLNTVKSSAEVIRGNRSRALQAVYDKMDFLNVRGR